MTSHVDLPATILPLLGVRNPPGDYSLGHDLRGSDEREFGVVADWSRIAIVGPDTKLTLPIGGIGFLQTNALTTRDDRPVSDPSAAYRSAEPELRRAIADLHRFRRTEGLPAQASLPSS